MKAAYREKYCTYEALTLRNIEKPEVKPGTVLVKIMATTVNRTDCAVLTGKPWIMRLFIGLFRPRIKVTGTDFAGTVEAVGEGVSGFRLGDRVWGFFDGGLATHAEYAAIPVKKNIMTIPEGVDFEKAVASLEAAHYAINFIKKIPFQSGQTVMVNGATGGIGSALVQLCRINGLKITATCRAEHAGIVKKMGAEKVIDYTRENFTQDAGQYDYVFDAVGKSSFSRCKKLLKKKGIYLSSELGKGSQNIFLALFTPLFGGKKVIFPVPSKIKDSMNRMHTLLTDGQFEPLIDRVMLLDEISAAFVYVASAQKLGNVIIKM